MDDAAAERGADALAAAALLAIDPAGLGGLLLRARHGPTRTRWLARLRALLPADMPCKRAPLGIADERLLGGLDLPATLRSGQPVAQRGLLAECNGGLVLLTMAERLSAGTAARLNAVLDRHEVLLERDGLALRLPARVGLVALDEACEDDEGTPPALAERLGIQLELDDGGAEAESPGGADADAIRAAGARLAAVQHDDATVEALCATAVALGVASMRAPLLALRAARAAAAWRGHASVQADDTSLAARLVLTPRATRWPAPTPEAQAEPEDPPPQDATGQDSDPPPSEPPPPADTGQNAHPLERDRDSPPPPAPDEPLPDQVLEAAMAALPPGLLARLKAGLGPRRPASPGGKAGALQAGSLRGRPVGSRRGDGRSGQRIDLITTLRTAAPWQALRRRELDAAASAMARPAVPVASTPPPVATATAAPTPGAAAGRRVLVRHDDLHVVRHAQRRETTTVFVVDASGSAAMHRLAEAKGAVERLLADCYVRRDRVALLAFRGQGAELVLPPTRSLVRAKRALAGQPGGGGTPLATALDAAAALTGQIVRRGGTPVLVLLTDGRANIGRSGQPGRAAALSDALAAARTLRAAGIATLLVDTAPASADPGPARALADALGALHLPLPQADGTRLSRAVQSVAGSGRG